MKGKRGRKKVLRKHSNGDSDLSDEPIYCICRSSKCDSFMIACDSCEEWYHGECINVSPKQAECIQTFYCQICRDKDPTLQIKFKNKNIDRHSTTSRQRSSGSLADESGDEELRVSKHTKRDRKHIKSHSRARRTNNSLSTLEVYSSEDDLEITPSQLASPSSGYSQPNSMHGSSSLRSAKPCHLISPDNKITSSWSRYNSRAKNSHSCGECEGCRRVENCGSCEVCRSPKFQQGRSRQKCLYRTCIGTEYPRNNSTRIRQSKISPIKNQMSDLDYDSHFDDYSTSRRIGYGSSNKSKTIGSKMRRGDHIPGGLPMSLRSTHERDIETTFPRGGSYEDDSILNNPDTAESYDESHSLRSRGSSSRYGDLHQIRQSQMESRVVRHTNAMMNVGGLDSGNPPLLYESDDDVVLPEMRPCSGPACSKPAIRSRYCSEECQLRHESHTMQRRDPSLRFNNPREEILIPYSLPYPDHLYCKHHRMHLPYDLNSKIDLQPGSLDTPDVYRPFSRQFLITKQSTNIDYIPAYDQVVDNPIPGIPNYRRIPNQDNVGDTLNDDDFALNCSSFIQNNSKHQISLGYSQQSSHLGHFDSLLVNNQNDPHSSLMSLGGRSSGRVPNIVNRQQQLRIPDSLPPELSLDAITPTVCPIGIYNGNLSTSNPDQVYRGDSRTDLISVNGNDVDINSSSIIGQEPSSTISAFRQSDDFYMMNENENMEINWPASPSNATVASASVV